MTSPTFVQSKGINAPFPITYNSAVTAGSTLLLVARIGATVTGLTVSDNVNAGNWTTQQVLEANDGHTLIIAYKQNSASGTISVNATWTGGGTTRYLILEYSNCVAASVDQISLVDRLNTTAPASPSVTTTQANETLVSCGTSGGGVTLTENASGSNPASGWVTRGNVDTNRVWVSDVSVSATGTYNETWTTSGDNTATGIITLIGPSGVAAAPFSLDDWSKPQAIRSVPPDQAHTNIGRFTNPIPFGPYDYSVPPRDVVSSPPQARPYNNLLFRNPIPFVVYDWSKPFNIPMVPGPMALYVDQPLTLIANLGPFNRGVQGGAFFPEAAVAHPYVYNQNLYTVTVAAPFVQRDWPPARPVRFGYAASDQGILDFQIPFGPYDWGRVNPIEAAQAGPQAYNFNLYAVTIQNPFIQFDWSRSTFPEASVAHPYQKPLVQYANLSPFTVDVWPTQFALEPAPQWQQPRNLNIALVGAPFSQLDWSKTQRVASVPPFLPQPNYPSFYPNPIPISNVQFTAPFKPPLVPPTPIPYNLSLYVLGPVALPFNQYDWPPVRGVRSGVAQSDQGIWSFDVPFAQSDWSKPSAVRLSVPRLDVYNQNLYQVVVGPLGVVFNQYNWPGVAPSRLSAPGAQQPALALLYPPAVAVTGNTLPLMGVG